MRLSLLIAVVLTVLVPVTSARAVTIRPGGRIVLTSNGRVTLGSTLATAQCDWELTGSIATSAVVGDTIGSIAQAEIDNCLGSITARSLIGLFGAWPIVLTQVQGTPITAALFTLTNLTFALSSPPCLYTGRLGMRYVEGGTSTASLLSNTVTSSLCGTASLSGSFTLFAAQDIT